MTIDGRHIEPNSREYINLLKELESDDSVAQEYRHPIQTATGQGVHSTTAGSYTSKYGPASVHSEVFRGLHEIADESEVQVICG